MIKRTVTETIYEYDKQGILIKKTVTETHEEEDNTTLTYPSTPPCPCPCTSDRAPWWKEPYITVTWTNGITSDATKSNTTTTTTIAN